MSGLESTDVASGPRTTCGDHLDLRTGDLDPDFLTGCRGFWALATAFAIVQLGERSRFLSTRSGGVNSHSATARSRSYSPSTLSAPSSPSSSSPRYRTSSDAVRFSSEPSPRRSLDWAVPRGQERRCTDGSSIHLWGGYWVCHRHRDCRTARVTASTAPVGRPHGDGRQHRWPWTWSARRWIPCGVCRSSHHACLLDISRTLGCGHWLCHLFLRDS